MSRRSPSAARASRPLQTIGARSWWCAAVALGAICLAPLLVTEVPPLLDYPNHLARMVVLAFAGGDPVLSRIYKADWRIIPNLAIDLVAPPMLSVLPVHVVGRLLLAMTLLLPGIGVVAYSRALFRERLFWPLASALVLSNMLFLLGFMNFLLSIGVALIVAAIWTAWRDRYSWRSALLCGAGTAAVFFCHLGGLVFLLILTGSAEAERLLVHLRRGSSVATVLRDGAPFLAMLLPALLLYCASPFATVSATAADHGTFAWKLCGLFASVIGYNVVLSLLVGFAVLLFVALCIHEQRWEAPLRSRIALTILLLAYVAAPFAAKGTVWIDARFSVMAGFLLFAGFTPRRLPVMAAAAATVVFVIMLMAGTGTIASNWSRSVIDLRELRAAIASVRPGTRVLVVRATPEAHPAYWAGDARRRRLLGMTTELHMAALLLIEHHAFWPLLFTTPSQQPVLVLPPYRELANVGGLAPDYHTLFIEHVAAAGLPDAPYLAHWRDRFDAILVLDADGVPELEQKLPEGLALVADTGFAALIRIRPGALPLDPAKGSRP